MKTKVIFVTIVCYFELKCIRMHFDKEINWDQKFTNLNKSMETNPK